LKLPAKHAWDGTLKTPLKLIVENARKISELAEQKAFLITLNTTRFREGCIN